MRPSPLRHPARLAGVSLLRLQSDERLAELALAGHEAAFDTIVDRYRTPLARYCAGIVGPSRAEDVVQQALINAHDALKRTDEVRHLRSWLYRIAHNASLNALRAVRDDVSLDAASGATAAPASDPAASFESSERFRATVAALQELPERQRAALVLRELEGRSHEEIAEALGVSKGSARQHLMRARTTMRGAVTAITPYPLLVRLADALSGPASTGWADAAVGAGAGATMAKLTAGVVATGALLGGAVGTSHVVHHRDPARSAGAATQQSPAKAGAHAVAISATPAAAGGTAPAGGSSSGSGSTRSSAGGGHGSSGRGRDGGARGHGDSSSGRGGSGDDRSGDHGSGGSGASGGSGSGSGSGEGGSGGHGSGNGDAGGRGAGSGDSGSSERSSGTEGSGSHGRGNGRSDDGSSSTTSHDGRSGSDGGGSGSGELSSSSGSGKGKDGSGSGDGGGDQAVAAAPVTETAPVPSTTTTSSGSGSSGDGGSGSDELTSTTSGGESGKGDGGGSGSSSGG